MGSLILVAGARPNFVKIAPILHALKRRSSLRPTLVHTDQHYDHAMSGVFFEQLGIAEPDVHLHVGSGTHGAQTARIMLAFEEHLLGLRESPRGVVVVGDVNSTLACALVAAKLHIPVAHVEAGLRSFDRSMPEEINRIATDAISDLLLVSEPAGMANLQAEGVAPERVRYCGNVMIDTLVEQLPAARALDMPRRFAVSQHGYAVVTLHRAANVDEPPRLRALLLLIEKLARRMPVVFPVHPRTRARMGELAPSDAIRFTEPLGYREFLGLVDGAALVLSDSGGIQEETTFLGIPCLTLRTSTERPITVSRGTNVLAGNDLDRAWQHVEGMVSAGRRMTSVEGWDGRAAERVVDALIERWGR